MGPGTPEGRYRAPAGPEHIAAAAAEQRLAGTDASISDKQKNLVKLVI